MPESSPSAPSGLAEPALRLWRSITTVYDLEEHEYALLIEACRTVNLLDELERAVQRDGALIDDGKGGTKIHPAAVEQRQQRIAMARMLAALRLPDEGDEARTQRRGIRGVYLGAVS